MSDKSSKLIAFLAQDGAPAFVQIVVLDPGGNEIADMTATARSFSSGAVGYQVSDKVKLASGDRLQASLNLPVVWSKYDRWEPGALVKPETEEE